MKYTHARADQRRTRRRTNQRSSAAKPWCSSVAPTMVIELRRAQCRICPSSSPKSPPQDRHLHEQGRERGQGRDQLGHAPAQQIPAQLGERALYVRAVAGLDLGELGGGQQGRTDLRRRVAAQRDRRANRDLLAAVRRFQRIDNDDPAIEQFADLPDPEHARPQERRRERRPPPTSEISLMTVSTSDFQCSVAV
ncbi:MAG: hypothetical protein HC927_06755 [Deltaproteobacteria bacterium]|nr:hypothetical protein [Deltaproteobacteria bacterium]